MLALFLFISSIFLVCKTKTRKIAVAKHQKGDWGIQAAKRDCKAPPNRDYNIWLCGRYGKVGVANFF